MAYREDRDAADARIAVLESDLEEARAKIQELEARERRHSKLERDMRTVDATLAAVAAKASKKKEERATTAPRGAIHFHPPPTYFPMFALYRLACIVAVERRPRFKEWSSESVLMWIVQRALLTPLTLVRLVAYALAMALLIPWAAIVATVVSIVMLPFLALSQLTFSEDPPARGGFFRGQPSRSSAAVFLWLVTMACPILLVAIIDLLGVDD